MNALNAIVSLGLGLLVGAIILATGLWMDRARDRRWQRELREPLPTRQPDIRFPRGIRYPEQQKNEDNQ